MAAVPAAAYQAQAEQAATTFQRNLASVSARTPRTDRLHLAQVQRELLAIKRDLKRTMTRLRTEYRALPAANQALTGLLSGGVRTIARSTDRADVERHTSRAMAEYDAALAYVERLIVEFDLMKLQMTTSGR